MTAGTSDFPNSLDTSTNLPVASGLSGVELDGDGNANKVHSNLHGTTDTAVVAIETKVGTGASTPTSGNVLRGTGTGTSAWAKVALASDVSGTLPVGNGGTGATTATAALTNLGFSNYGKTLIDDADAAAARTTLGLGSISTQAANSVAITGGSIQNLTTFDGITIDGGSF